MDGRYATDVNDSVKNVRTVVAVDVIELQVNLGIH